MNTKMLFFLLLLTLKYAASTNSGEVKSIEKQPNSFLSLGYFNGEDFVDRRLVANALTTKNVEHDGECVRHCLHHGSTCRSYNIIDNAVSNEKICEIFDTDAFEGTNTLVEDLQSKHFSLKTKCWESPCKNNGQCIPNYTDNTFTCVCTFQYSGEFCQDLTKPRECLDHYNTGSTTDGIYKIYFPDGQTKDVRCDMTNGGWTVIQKRIDGSVSFDRPWIEYENGFGVVPGEYWIGNKFLHELTKNGASLNVSMVYKGDPYYAYYGSFIVHSASEKYKVTQSGFQGTASNNLENNVPFSTPDRDNDYYPNLSCAATKKSGFWFSACGKANPNGNYLETGYQMKLVWIGPSTSYDSLDSTEMKIKMQT